MKLYFLYSRANANGDRVVVSDKQDRIAGYLIWNTNDGKFLNFITIQGRGQDYLTASEIRNADYLDCVISVPIFSKSAREVFKAEFPEEIDFHPISVMADTDKFDFFIGKSHKYLNILNKKESEYRPMADGSPVLSIPVLEKNFDEDFYIARDRDEPQILVVSQKFVDLCEKHKVNIGFLEARQR